MAGEPTVLFGVGATKSGTSWLHDYLAGHPDCFFRTLKELHYFDTLESGNFARQIQRIGAEVDRLNGKIPEARGDKQRRLKERLRDHADWLDVLRRKRPDHSAYGAYLAGRGDRKVVGDITPAYGLLPAERLTEMAGLARDVRFVYLMRDPVSRLWSHVRMLVQRRKGAVGEAESKAKALMDEVLTDPGSPMSVSILSRGDYADTLLRLSSAVPPSQLFVAFMEDLITPEGVKALCGFLGAREHPARVERRVHEGMPLALDARRKAAARDLLRPQYQFIADLFPAMPQAWRSNMDEVAA